VLGREANIEQQEAAIAQATAKATGASFSETEQLLIVQVSSDVRAAIPLNEVRRLEEFRLQDIERVSSSSVIQYRGSILQLVDVASIVTGSNESWSGGHVVVVGRGESLVGLQVQTILDVSREITAVKPVRGKPGIISYGVIQGKVIALLDVNYLLQQGAMSISVDQNEERVAI
jgi:two-component system chemotaxis sensor kinase CheA